MTDLTATGPASFFAWLNAPAEASATVQFAESEYELAPVFVNPVAERLTQWSSNGNTAGPTPLRATLDLDAPQLTGPAPSH
jgi:hypothetical protein